MTERRSCFYLGRNRSTWREKSTRWTTWRPLPYRTSNPGHIGDILVRETMFHSYIFISMYELNFNIIFTVLNTYIYNDVISTF